MRKTWIIRVDHATQFCTKLWQKDGGIVTSTAFSLGQVVPNMADCLQSLLGHSWSYPELTFGHFCLPQTTLISCQSSLGHCWQVLQTHMFHFSGNFETKFATGSNLILYLGRTLKISPLCGVSTTYKKKSTEIFHLNNWWCCGQFASTQYFIHSKLSGHVSFSVLSNTKRMC